MRYEWILAVLCAVLFFAGNALLPITDPVESNYVLTAGEMLNAEDWVSPRIYGHYWYDKPIMFYWELMIAFSLFGINEFAARFFPSLVATGGVFLTYWFAARLYDRHVGFTAAVILATSVEYWYLAHAVITDMTLFLSISAALSMFYIGYSEQRPRLYYAAYAASAVAVLTKGPIGLCLPGLIIIIFLLWQGDLRHLGKMRLLSGLVVFGLVVSVWYLPMYKIHGDGFIGVFLGVHNYLRATVSEHPNQDVIYYYLLIFIAGFVPWVFAAMYALLKKIKGQGLPELDQKRRFLFVWAFTVPVVFQCFATKYLTYTLPYMMPLAIMFALYYAEREKLFRRLALGSAVVLSILLVTVAKPACEYNSEKQAADIITPEIGADTYILSYGRRYPASLVFYLGNRTVWRLEEAHNIIRLSPHAMSWSSTNVMPFISCEDVPSDKKTVAIVGKKNLSGFWHLMPNGKWHYVGETPTSVIYKREAQRL